MPANLTPQYHKAEEDYRRASTPDEELRCLEAMLRELPKHKGTDKLQAELKQKISRARKEAEQQGKKGPARGAGAGHRIPHQGAGRAVLIGGPNSGKSALLAAMTRATPEIAAYPFTTREPLPGMMPWEDVMVQLIDTPPITGDVLDPSIQGLIRGADLVLFVVDVGNDEGIDAAQEVVERLGGTKTRLARDSYLDEDDVGLSYTRALLVLNKVDLSGSDERDVLLREFCPIDLDALRVSAASQQGLESLRETIYRALDVVRVYTKLPSKKEPDFDRPFTVRRGGTLLQVAELVHRDLARDLKFARVWGKNVHDGTIVKGDYVVHDRDVVELHA
ncbi:MAG: TGS domain-containing protein [Planctomycetes bacterium]|nr:TGS domain-containing protein [Planctomycetota bacterium]